MTEAGSATPPRILIAGLGNVFRSDDGFGVAVAQLLSEQRWPDGVVVKDYGVRALHLAFDLEDYDAVVLVDAMSMDVAPGTVGAFEPGRDVRPGQQWDAHTVTPDAVLAAAAMHGVQVGTVMLVGCQPECLDDGMGLSPTVAAAVPGAAALCREVVSALRGAGSTT